jgi:16S rRNA (guanine527-N7)-methyltransferase
MAEIEALLSQGLAQLGLSPDAAPVLADYERLLLEKNQVMNLTAITDPIQAAQLHYLDCAALAAHFRLEGKKLIDVGTGAGFPGMVLAALEPSLQVTLLDSLGKRITWLKEISPALGRPDVECIHGRAEDYGVTPQYREQYDLATSRAVADLRLLCELCLPFVKVGGYFLSMKSVDSREEVSAAEHGIRLLGGKVLDNLDYTIPGTQVSHRVVIIEKVKPTPKGYPRRFAKIQKSPL